jgi:hypothetical protein
MPYSGLKSTYSGLELTYNGLYFPAVEVGLEADHGGLLLHGKEEDALRRTRLAAGGCLIKSLSKKKSVHRHEDEGFGGVLHCTFD